MDSGSVLALLLISLALTAGSFDRARFPGEYCKNRTLELEKRCCTDRKDNCSVYIGDHIHSSRCYCDHFCVKSKQHRVEDCCPDYHDVCRGNYATPQPTPPTPITQGTGKYCKSRALGQQCCTDRNDDCSVYISDGKHSSLCYCDHFCVKSEQHKVEDCCPDYHDVCQGNYATPQPTPPTPITQGECSVPGEKCKLGCNECTCVEEIRSYYFIRYKWQCGNLACINDEDMISRINDYRHHYGWTATAHPQFKGMTLRDGRKYLLGTLLPKDNVFLQNAVSAPSDFRPAFYFDARFKWPGLILPAMNQGRCASSWACASTGVAADRLAIQSKDRYAKPLSVQQMISCNDFVISREPCDAGRIEDAWWWLQHKGVVYEECYPYTSGYDQQRGYCKDERRLVCPSREYPRVHRTTSAYRVACNEKAIMYEIQTNGPVQAIIKVRADFFLYDRGVYSYTAVPEYIKSADHRVSGYHSVKIIGWGIENGTKYWLAVNSWGQSWGDYGRFKIKRGENESDIERFLVAAGTRTHAGRLSASHRRRHG